MQGCGKTTIVEVLEAVFKHEGMRPASISIDDFYLRFEDQQALAKVSLTQLTPPLAHLSGKPDKLACTTAPQIDALTVSQVWHCCKLNPQSCTGSPAILYLCDSPHFRNPMQAKSDNKLLQVRGNAGTHDLQLGKKTLEALQSAVSPDKEVALPRYDKSKNEGRGDRAERSSWPNVQGPIDIILFEGWMLGFSPVSEADVAGVDLFSVIFLHDAS